MDGFKSYYTYLVDYAYIQPNGQRGRMEAKYNTTIVCFIQQTIPLQEIMQCNDDLLNRNSKCVCSRISVVTTI